MALVTGNSATDWRHAHREAVFAENSATNTQKNNGPWVGWLPCLLGHVFGQQKPREHLPASESRLMSISSPRFTYVRSAFVANVQLSRNKNGFFANLCIRVKTRRPGRARTQTRQTYAPRHPAIESLHQSLIPYARVLFKVVAVNGALAVVQLKNSHSS